MEASLSKVGTSARPSPPAPLKRQGRGGVVVGGGLSAACTALIAVGFATGNMAMVYGGIIGLVFGGLLLFTAIGRTFLSHVPGVPLDPTRPHVGLGAEVASDAVVEPGASVEMGADVESGAIVRRGAIVRMGSTIGKNAVIESGAVVSWGADVMAGAVVGAGSTIGAGATVHENARVPRDTHLLPGQDFTAGMSGNAGPAKASDPRHARIDAACDRLLNDLAKTPENLRSFLGDPDRTVSALRGTCHDLLEREKLMRAEAAPEALERLDEEKKVLTARRDKSTDEAVRRSLDGALAAIDDQRRQRGHLSAIAERLDAEATRLVLTLEAMSSQVVRLSAASAGSAEATPALAQSAAQLQNEIEAVAEALEGLTREDAGMQPIAPISNEAPAMVGQKVRE